MSSFASQKDTCNWIFIYYAPYDNDLSVYADSILNQLSSASKYDNIRVVFQVDKEDTLGMYRYTIGPNGIQMDSVTTELSTSGATLQAYLDWVNQNFQFERSALFFLDHGGRLDEVGQDLYPDSTFLKITDIRNALHHFNETNNKLVDLIYLQVCAKSSIEPLYELHDVAAYTLACQKLLGAPNFYYKNLLKHAHQNPEITGRNISKIIAVFDRTNMFESLTCINNSKFEKVILEFQFLVEKLEKRREIVFSRAPVNFDYATDRYWDLIDFLDCLDLKRNSEKKARDRIKAGITDGLIEFKYVDASKTDTYSGISIAALSKDRIKAFSHMRFYDDFGLDRLPIH